MTPRRKTLVGLLILIGISIALLSFFAIPLKLYSSSLSDQRDEQRLNLQLIEQSKQKSSTNEEIAELESIKQEIDALVMKENDELLFFTQLETMAKETGVTQEVKLTPPEGRSLQPLSVDVTLTGSFQAIADYVARIEQLTPYTDIASLQITSGQGPQFVLSARLLASVYWQPHE